MAKTLRKNAYNVLIVKPHNIEHQCDERVNQWIMKQFSKGLAEYWAIPSKTPEVARNHAINMFLTDPKWKSKTHLFFLDADTLPCSDFAIEKLLYHNKAVTAGVTPIIRGNLATGRGDITCYWSALKWDEQGEYDTIGINDLPRKLFKSPRVGGTTILLRRDVLEKLKKPYQKNTFSEDMTQQILSEDFYFSDKIREAGFDIWVDPDVKCHHFHNFDLLDVFDMVETARKGNLK